MRRIITTVDIETEVVTGKFPISIKHQCTTEFIFGYRLCFDED